VDLDLTVAGLVTSLLMVCICRTDEKLEAVHHKLKKIVGKTGPPWLVATNVVSSYS